ncbi:MAG TPA: hypothetical protein VK625_07100 [Flavitalea sp.]|nr:hypothetical protein [Flavitalea sp.]
MKVLKDTSPPITEDDFEELKKYFQTMAKYKYDDYQQFSTGMRFIERFALWLKYFTNTDRVIALDFIRKKLIYVSHAEMNLLVSSAFPDVLRNYFIADVAKDLGVEEYEVAKVVSSANYKKLIRQSLFCGMSDGARIEIFRRANTGIISHEQIYQTYELSDDRAGKMKEELGSDLADILESENIDEADKKFKRVFLLDDFSASGTSYLKYNTEKDVLKGKIAALYNSLFKNAVLADVFDLENLKVYVVIYLCTQQAKDQIESNFSQLQKEHGNKPELICLHIIPNTDKLNSITDSDILSLCKNDRYYDAKELEDKHTGKDVKLGFGNCALPLVLAHNTPNNSVPLLWSYDTSIKFKGLFPRIPRHKEI